MSPTLQKAIGLMNAGSFLEAKPLLLAAIQREPRNVEAALCLSDCLAHLGDLQPALHHAKRGATLAPAQPAAWRTLAMIAIGAADWAICEDACRSWQKTGGGIDATRTLAYTLQRLSKFGEVVEIAAAEHARNPLDTDMCLKHAVALVALARGDDACAVLRAGIDAAGPVPELLDTLAYTCNFRVPPDPAATIDAHAAAAHARAKHLFASDAGTAPIPRPARPPVSPSALDGSRPLRVGLLSPDLREHSVAFFAAAVIAHGRAAGLDIRVFSTAGREDDFTAALRTHLPPASWHSMKSASSRQTADSIAAEQLDVLFELSGLTHGNHQPALLFFPAPVQVTWMGYPSTTGNAAIDFRLVDAITDPPHLRGHCTETLLRMTGCFICFTPLYKRVPPPADPTARLSHPITFGSFNALSKLNSHVLRVWGQIVSAVPGSRMIIKCRGLEEPGTRALLHERLRTVNAPVDQFDLRGTAATQFDHLAAYQHIDLALDTFPYNGTTTTCEALFMGVPVLTYCGPVHAARVGGSLLDAAGLGSLVAGSEDEFVDLAIRLASDRAGLSELSRGLRERVLASSLCDAPGFATRFAAACHEMVADIAKRQ